MKKFFSKDNFIFSSLATKEKRISLCVSCVLLLAFIFSAFTFFNSIYVVSDCVGSIVCASIDVSLKDLLRSLPIFLTCFMSIWTLLLCHAFYRNVDEDRRNKSLFKNSIALCAFSGVAILYILIGLIVGKYSSLVEGSPSPLYPLDVFLYALLFLAIGVCGILYKLKFAAKFPYVMPSRGPIVKKARFVYCLGISIWMLVSLFGFADFFIGLFVIDFIHGYAFYGIMLLIAMLLPSLLLGLWEFYFNELKEEKRKEFLLPLSICSLAVSVVVLALYFVALGTNLDAPSNMGFGVLPIAFAASVNMATLVVVFTPLIVSIVALVKGLLLRRKK